MNWINIEERKPSPCQDILFTNGKDVFKGWLETYDPLEDLSFYSDRAGLFEHWPEDITYWMPLPELPKVKE